ncbi:MAG: hypothetical protein GC199_04345 [Alphaproteobacteria bacterium]|nr:hypothetical protein [Alphaproteobacteria bacterium]
MVATHLSKVRRSILPHAGDSWATIAGRELSGLSEQEAVAKLQSWNLHVFMRAPAPAESPRAGNPILPSDVIFVEPPLAKA